jgi:hypothetical protein
MLRAESVVTFTSECYLIWNQVRSMIKEGELQAMNGLAGREVIRDLVRRGRAIYDEMYSDRFSQHGNNAPFRQGDENILLVRKYYQLLEGLLNVVPNTPITAGSIIATSIQASAILTEKIGGHGFARAMYSLLDVLYILRSNPQDFLEHLPERIKALAEEVVSDWKDKFTPEKTLLVLVLIPWHEDLRNPTVDQYPTYSIVLVTKRLPLSEQHPVELYVTVEGQGLVAPKLRLELDTPMGVQPADFPGQGGSAWSRDLEPVSQRVGSYDFTLGIVQSNSNAPNYVRLQAAVLDIGGKVSSQELTIENCAGREGNYTIPDDPIEEWLNQGISRLLGAAGDRYVLTLQGHRIGDKRLDAHGFSDLLRPVSVVPVKILRGEEVDRNHIGSALSTEGSAIWILELPDHLAVVKMMDLLNARHAWYAHLSDLLSGVFPGLVCTESALRKLEDALSPISEAQSQKLIFEHMGDHLSTSGFFYLDEGSASDICERAQAPLETLLRPLSDLFVKLQAEDQELLLNLARAIDERSKSIESTVLETKAVELGHIRDHFGSSSFDIDLFGGMERLVANSWCRREGGFLYSFSSAAHLECVRRKYAAA